MNWRIAVAKIKAILCCRKQTTPYRMTGTDYDVEMSESSGDNINVLVESYTKSSTNTTEISEETKDYSKNNSDKIKKSDKNLNKIKKSDKNLYKNEDPIISKIDKKAIQNSKSYKNEQKLKKKSNKEDNIKNKLKKLIEIDDEMENDDLDEILSDRLDFEKVEINTKRNSKGDKEKYSKGDKEKYSKGDKEKNDNSSDELSDIIQTNHSINHVNKNLSEDESISMETYINNINSTEEIEDSEVTCVVKHYDSAGYNKLLAKKMEQYLYKKRR